MDAVEDVQSLAFPLLKKETDYIKNVSYSLEFGLAILSITRGDKNFSV